MKKKCILTLLIILTIGGTACSSASGNDTAPAETTAERETQHKETAEATVKADEAQTNPAQLPQTEAAQDSETETTPDLERISPDPFIGIVEAYAGELITISNLDDGMLLYFSTKNAEIIEGESPITVGDKVEITYQGLMGDETAPTEAVKIVAIRTD